MSMAMRMVPSDPGLCPAVRRRAGGLAVGLPRRRRLYPGRMPSAAALPTDPGPYGPTGRSAWLDVDWREHRLVAFDLPGFGFSDMPGEKISIPGYGRLVDALLDELGVGSAVLVGNSMGGFIAAEVAIQFPARVQRLVLVSAAGLTIEYQRDERILGALRFGQRLVMAWGGFVGARSEAVARRPRSRELLLRLVVAHPDRLPAPLVSEQVRGSGDPGFVDALDALTDYPIRARLGEIGCPTLIVWGAEDRLVPVRDADEFERLIPDARKVVWPETGHAPMLERPAAFNALVDRFIAEGPGERVGGGGARSGRARRARPGGGR